MVESNLQELTSRLQSEKDWHQSAIFTDKGEVLASIKAVLRPDEIQ